MIPILNIQEPYASLILDGRKTAESRKYKPPPDKLNREILICAEGQLVGTVRIVDFYRCTDIQDFRSRYEEHLVPEGSVFEDSEKYLWRLESAKRFKKSIPAPPCMGRNEHGSRGIVWGQYKPKDLETANAHRAFDFFSSHPGLDEVWVGEEDDHWVIDINEPDEDFFDHFVRGDFEMEQLSLNYHQ